MAGQLMPPKDGVTVRMYRIGHGDCFLLAFAGTDPATPTYVLIDCGYKPGSAAKINPPRTAQQITDDIKAATGGRIDVAIITHEHQDHVNGITATRFTGVTIGEAWFAWTENPTDDFANQLRIRFKDTLLGLMAARNRLAAAGDEKRRVALDEFLAFELGGEDAVFDLKTAPVVFGADGVLSNSRNKESMKVVKDAAGKIEFLYPHEKIWSIPGAPHVRVFPLGPPKNTADLASLDPAGREEFTAHAMARPAAGNHFAAAAVAAEANAPRESPFSARYSLKWKSVVDGSADHDGFFSEHYVGAEPWRNIDHDWLYASSQLALDMNDQTNNSSLVLAFELGKGGKVLLFAADAQRGNWISWAKKDVPDGPATVKVRDLLSRTVLYKVGHHGSHNATLNGSAADTYSNLSWMGEGPFAREFCAMITAVRAWAETQKGWDHPLKEIKDALLAKASGRVFQTDTDFASMTAAGGLPDDWDDFKKRTAAKDLYFDYQIVP